MGARTMPKSYTAATKRHRAPSAATAAGAGAAAGAAAAAAAAAPSPDQGTADQGTAAPNFPSTVPSAASTSRNT